MIIVMKSNAKSDEVKRVKEIIESKGLITNISKGGALQCVKWGGVMSG